MVIESSYEEELVKENISEEKKLLIGKRQDFVVCIPEYRKEIYRYLREAEVSSFHKIFALTGSSG